MDINNNSNGNQNNNFGRDQIINPVSKKQELETKIINCKIKLNNILKKINKILTNDVQICDKCNCKNNFDCLTKCFNGAYSHNGYPGLYLSKYNKFITDKIQNENNFYIICYHQQENLPSKLNEAQKILDEIDELKELIII